jgi:hypothetical protein
MEIISDKMMVKDARKEMYWNNLEPDKPNVS